MARVLLFVFGLLGTFLSYLTVDLHVKLRVDPSFAPSFCTLSKKISCAPVIGSHYSELFGVPLGSYGVLFYLTLILMLFVSWGKKVRWSDPFLVLGLASILVSIALFLVSEFLIGAICPVCLAMYAVNAAITLTAYFAERDLSFFARGASGIATLCKAPFALLEIKIVPWITALMITGIAVGAFFLPHIAYELLTQSEEFLKKETQAITAAVEEWRNVKPDQIPLSVTQNFYIDYTVGPDNAPIQLVEFSDYQCPACRVFIESLEGLVKEYAGKIRVVHKDFPIDNACNPFITHRAHQHACFAAQLARCAGEQGKFWEVHDYLFTTPLLEEELRKDTQLQLKKGLSIFALDSQGLEQCLMSERQIKKIQEDIKVADTLHLEGTPSVWVNGKKVTIVHEKVLRPIFDSILSNQQK